MTDVAGLRHSWDLNQQGVPEAPKPTHLKILPAERLNSVEYNRFLDLFPWKHQGVLKPLSPDNKKDCMRVAKALCSNEGYTFTQKGSPKVPVFVKWRKGDPLMLNADLVAVLKAGLDILPMKWAAMPPDTIHDKRNGWAFNHPMTYLIRFQCYKIMQAMHTPVPSIEGPMALTLVASQGVVVGDASELAEDDDEDAEDGSTADDTESAPGDVDLVPFVVGGPDDEIDMKLAELSKWCSEKLTHRVYQLAIHGRMHPESREAALSELDTMIAAGRTFALGSVVHEVREERMFHEYLDNGVALSDKICAWARTHAKPPEGTGDAMAEAVELVAKGPAAVAAELKRKMDEGIDGPTSKRRRIDVPEFDSGLYVCEYGVDSLVLLTKDELEANMKELAAHSGTAISTVTYVVKCEPNVAALAKEIMYTMLHAYMVGTGASFRIPEGSEIEGFKAARSAVEEATKVLAE